jgi:hypothetical protein
MASPKITDFFLQKPQLTSPKPAKGLLAFFSPPSPKGKLNKTTETKDQLHVSSQTKRDENCFTKIRPTDVSTVVEDQVTAISETSKTKKRKPDEVSRSDAKKRRKEKVDDPCSSLDDFEVEVSKQEKDVSSNKKPKNVKKREKKSGKKDLGKVDKGSVLEKNSKQDREFSCMLKDGTQQNVEGTLNAGKFKVVKLPSLEDHEPIDDSVVSVSYVDFLSDIDIKEEPVADKKNYCVDDVADGEEDKNIESETKSNESVCAKEGENSCSGSEVEVIWADFKAENCVMGTDVTDSVGSDECANENEKKDLKKGQNKREKSLTLRDSGDDFVGNSAKATKESKGVSVRTDNDIVDGDGTEQKIWKARGKKKAVGKEPASSYEASVELKGKKGDKKKRNEAKVDESGGGGGDDEPKTTLGIAKFFVKRDSEAVVKADVHSPQSQSSSAAIVLKERRRSSNVVVNSSDSDAIEELGTFPVTPAKECESDANAQSSPAEVKYPAFFFAKKVSKKVDTKATPDTEEPMEVEKVQPKEQTSGGISEQEEESTSVANTKPKIREEILIENSTGEENPPDFSSPPVPAGKNPKQMTFNFTGGNFKMEKGEDQNKSVTTSTSDNESNTEVMDEVTEVNAKKNLFGFFTSTPKVSNAKKVVNLGKQEKVDECEESTDDCREKKGVARKGPAKKKCREAVAWKGLAKKKGKVLTAKEMKPNTKPVMTVKEGTPVAKKGSRKRVVHVESPEKIETPVAKRQRPRRGVYRATMVDEMKSTLRMKITR